MLTKKLSLMFLALALPSLAVAGEDSNPIENFHQVAPGIFRGGSPGPEGVAYLKKMGFKTILNLEARKKTLKAEEEAAKKHGLYWYSDPITLFRLPGDERIDKMLEVMSNPANHPVFVHCRAGRDRTGMLVALYRVEHERVNPAHAWQEALDMGFRKIYFPLQWIFERRTGYDL